MTQSCQKRFYAATLIVLFTLQLFAVVGGPELPDPGNPHMSREQQEQLGLQAAAQVYQTMPVLPDSSPETQYIRQLGEKLVATIPPNTPGHSSFTSSPRRRSTRSRSRADPCSSDYRGRRSRRFS